MCHWPVHFSFGFSWNFECSIVDILNILIALLGFRFSIYTFWKQNKENRKTTIDQNNKNWYLSVLVIPYLDRINVFFDDLVNAIKELKKGGDNNDLILRAKEQCDNKEKVGAFFAPIEATLASYDDFLRECVFNLGLRLQDEVTNIISEANIEPIEIECRIMAFKGTLIGILYRPIKSDENNSNN